MRKFFNSCALVWNRCILAVVALLAGGLAASAATFDFGEIELGKEYPFDAFSVVSATVTPPSDGKILILGGEWLYADANHSEDLRGEHNGAYGPAQGYTYEVKGGHTYYIYTSFTWEAGVLRADMEGEAPLKTAFISPAPGDVFNLNMYTDICFHFDQPFVLNKATLTYTEKSGDKKTVDTRHRIGGTELFVNVADIMKPLVENGTVAPGSEFIVTLDGLKTEKGSLYDNTENPTFAYSISSIGLVTTSVKIPTSFKSYWPKGDPEGLLTMTFNGELYADGGFVDMLYGNVEGDMGVDFYYTQIPYTTNGNTLICDLTGVRRTNSDMISGGPYSKVTLVVKDVKDAQGFPVASPALGTIGTYTYDLDFDDLPRAELSAEFTPENGTSLNGKESLEIWIKGLNMISFTGFKFEWDGDNGTESAVVPVDQAVKSEVSADGNEATYTIIIPANARGKKNVHVTLDGIIAKDGYDHSLDISATYDGFVLTYVSPANGARMDSLPKGTVIEVATNVTEQYPEMYMVYEIEDMNPVDPMEAMVKSQSWLTRQEDGTYTATIPRDIKMVTGHSYKATFTAWENEMAKNYRQDPIGEASVLWEGAAPPFRYSDVTLESITPADKSRITSEDRVFTLKFNGLVTLPAENNFIVVGMGATTAFESIVPDSPVPSEDVEGEFSTLWTVTVPESFMNSLDSDLTLSFKAMDSEGRWVQGNIGIEENTYFLFSYEMASAFVDYEIYPTGEEPVEKIDQFLVFEERGIMPSYTVPFDQAVVMNRFREVVAHVADVIPVVPEDIENNPDFQEYNVTECQLVLDKAIDEEGVYILQIPEGFFVIGKEFTAWKSAEKVVEYTVAGTGIKATSNPAEGDVNSLKTIVLTFNHGVMATGMAPEVTITKEGAEPVIVTDVVGNDNEENPWATEITVNLPEEIKEPGKYTLTIPAQYFYIQGTFAYSNELNLVYNVIEGAVSYPVTVTPAPGVVESLSTIHLVFDNESEIGVGSGKATISINGGEAENLPDADLDWDVWNAVNQPLGKTYTEAGTYVVSFPAGYFTNASGEPLPALSFTYTIEGAQQLASFEVYPEGTEVQPELSQFFVFSEAGLELNAGVEGRIELMDLDRNVLAVGSVSLTDNGGAVPTEAMIQLDNVITASGRYVLNIPEGYFFVGGVRSEAKTIGYSVVGVPTVTSDPAEGEVASLKVLTLTFSTGMMETGMGEAVTIAKVGGEPVEVAAVMDEPTEENPWVNKMTVTLPEEITEDGNYILTIPERYFYIEGSFQYSPEFTLKYSVVGEPAKFYETDPAEGLVDHLYSIEFTFVNEEEASMGAGVATMTIDGGEPIRLPDAEFGIDWNQVVQPLGDYYDAAGTYVLNFPAGYFTLGTNGDPAPAITLTYKIIGAGIEGLEADANGEYVVYNVAGVLVLKTKSAQEVKALRGLYIINGVKCFIK